MEVESSNYCYIQRTSLPHILDICHATRACTSTRAHARTHARTHTHTHTQTHTHIHIHIHAHTSTHTYNTCTQGFGNMMFYSYSGLVGLMRLYMHVLKSCHFVICVVVSLHLYGCITPTCFTLLIKSLPSCWASLHSCSNHGCGTKVREGKNNKLQAPPP